jgi:hypothetical protein
VRLPVQDVFKGRQGGTCVGGKLEAGALKPGSKVLVVPGHVTATVKGLEVNSQVRDLAIAFCYLCPRSACAFCYSILHPQCVGVVEGPCWVTSSLVRTDSHSHTAHTPKSRCSCDGGM